MIDTKTKIIIYIIVLIIFGFIIFNLLNKNNTETIEENIVSNIQYNNETGEYYIKDKNGEILHSTQDEASLYIYTIDPEYDPKIIESE